MARGNKRYKKHRGQPWYVKSKPWYRKYSKWIYWIILFAVVIPIVNFFTDLHRRTLLYVYPPKWMDILTTVLCIILILYVILSVIITVAKIKIRNKKVYEYLFFFSLGYCMLVIISVFSVALFDSVNRIFADRQPINATGIVTWNKQYIPRVGVSAFSQSHYLTTVNLPAEGRRLKIDDYKLYNVPANTEIIITYRRGLFGVDIFDTFTYYAEKTGE